MRHVLFINPAGYIGGAEKSLLDLAEHLRPEGVRPLVVLLSPGPLGKALRERGIDCRLLPLPPALLGLSRKSGPPPIRPLFRAPFLLGPATARLVKLIREEKVSLIHTNGIKAHLLAILPALLSGRPLVWHFRDLPGRGGYGRIFRFLARLFPRRVIANSLAVKKQLGNLGRIRVVYNGVEVPPPLNRSEIARRRNELGLSGEEIAIGAIGHFAPLKGYEDLIGAVPLILEKVPAVRVLIVGDALYPAYRDYRRELENRVERMGLANKVIFTGGRNDPGEVLPALDIFVHPSRSEGFGRANLEAMAFGLPVVSTDVGGIPEVVINGETGILVPSRNPEAIAEAVIALAGDGERRAAMGRAGRKRALDFSLRRMAEGTVAVYDEILPGRTR